MKHRDLKHCGRCNRGVMHAGNPTFYLISIQQFLIDLSAVQRAHGFELMMGSPALANIMGRDEDLAVPVSEKREEFLCLECLMIPVVLWELLEKGEEDQGGEDARTDKHG